MYTGKYKSRALFFGPVSSTNLLGALVGLVADEPKASAVALIVLHDHAGHYLAIGLECLKKENYILLKLVLKSARSPARSG